MRRVAYATAVVMLAGVGLTLAGPTNWLRVTLPSQLDAFFQPGSQPNPDLYSGFISSSNCKGCHEFQPGSVPSVIFGPWQGSMMAQAARDPLFYACLAIANQDASFAGDLCLRCHTPGGWLSGRSTPTDGSALTAQDRDGISCSVCHLMVDPFLKPTSPFPDAAILAVIEPLPTQVGGGNFIMDPDDRRRGPFDDPLVAHPVEYSPFHLDSALCGTCHDVSNPLYERQPDGRYTLTSLFQPHPTGRQYDMFPLERTYSEWLYSDFASQGVNLGARFGAGGTEVSTCQDCHMPDTEGYGCVIPGTPQRGDVPAHDLAGGNAWVQDMVWNLYPDDGLSEEYLEAGKARSASMLQRACTLEAWQEGNRLAVRVTNETGHKLPTGYPEGRRMWIHVEVFDAALGNLREFGAYDSLNAELSANDTKVYEVQLGIDETIAAFTGLPAGPGFHFALSNVVFKDNRIPPRGFRNATYQEASAAPVGVFYNDGQHWDDTRFRLPPGAASATVNVYYQTASKEYITFLRDANQTNNAGDVLYAQWELTGKSPPVLMASVSLLLVPFANGDGTGNGLVDWYDHQEIEFCFMGPDLLYDAAECAVFDFDADGDVDSFDWGEFQLVFEGAG